MVNLDPHYKDNKTIKLGLNGLIILFGVVWISTEFFWRMPFTFGNVGGIYWFLYYFEKLSLPLATLALVITLLLSLTAIVIRITKRGNYLHIAKTAGALFLASLLLEIAAFKPFQPETRHLDTLRVHDQLYYLTGYSAFDTNYVLYKCDSVGIFCKQLFRSSDFMPEWFFAKLVYYSATDELAIDVNNEGEIYRYKLP